VQDSSEPGVVRRSKWLLTIVGLLIAFVVPELGIGRHLFPHSNIPSSLGREIVWWCIALALIAYVLFVEKRPLRSVGFRKPTWKTFVFGLLGAAIAIMLFPLCFALIFPLLHLRPNTAAMNSILHTPWWFRLLLVGRAGFVEELLYRAYPIERLRERTGSATLAVIVSIAAFTYAHLAYWGAAHLIIVGLGAIVFALLYLWRRDFFCNVIAHFVSDAAGFLLSP